jgi:uncharacterized membrane protein
MFCQIQQPRNPLLNIGTRMSNIWAAGLLITPVIGVVVSLFALVSQVLTDQPCPTKGCLIVGSYATFGEIPILTMGILLFFLLTAGAICSILHGRYVTSMINAMDKCHFTPALFMEILLVSSLAMEGYLVGFQLFVAQNVCIFCLTVFALLVLTTIFFALSVRPFVLLKAGAVFVTVLLGLILVSPGNNLKVTRLSDMTEDRIFKGNPMNEFYLIYGDECTHCEDIIKYCSTFNSDIDVRLCPVEKSGPLLSALGINSVPTMIVNAPGRMEIIVGKNRIIEYIESTNIYSMFEVPIYHHAFQEGDSVCSQTSPCMN